MKRGINMKKILITIDEETWLILSKYRKWGTPTSAHIRKAVRAYEFKQKPQSPLPEDLAITYD